MTELWIPNTSAGYDPDNLFDSMVAFQSKIDHEASDERKICVAEVALCSLRKRFGDMHDKEWSLSLTTELATIDSTSGQNSFAVVERIGMIGSIDDLCAIRLLRFKIPISLSLQLDIESVFHVDDPDNSNILLASGKVPLNRVSYIEYDT